MGWRNQVETRPGTGLSVEDEAEDITLMTPGTVGSRQQFSRNEGGLMGGFEAEEVVEEVIGDVLGEEVTVVDAFIEEDLEDDDFPVDSHRYAPDSPVRQTRGSPSRCSSEHAVFDDLEIVDDLESRPGSAFPPRSGVTTPRCAPQIPIAAPPPVGFRLIRTPLPLAPG